MCDVGGEVGFEALEGLPVLAAKEFVLEVSEDLFGGAARGAQVTRPAARRRRPAPPSYPPVVRPSVRARAELDEEIFSLSASTRSSLSMGARRLSRLGALVAAVLAPVAAALWWWF